jgi:hypothetical protein
MPGAAMQAIKGALSAGRAPSQDLDKVDLLLRFFQSSFFNEWICVQ